MQPVIRRDIRDKSYSISDNDIAQFIEVQNFVDTNWWNNMTKDEIEEVLFQIYSEMRSQGLLWTDIKANNVGKLLRPNKTNISLFVDENRRKIERIPPNKAIGFIGEAQGEVLQEGEYVIIDTDYIMREEDYKKETYCRSKL